MKRQYVWLLAALMLGGCREDERIVQEPAVIPPQVSTAVIFAMNSDGSGARQLTDDWMSNINPSFSPDGSEIVFVVVNDSN